MTVESGIPYAGHLARLDVQAQVAGHQAVYPKFELVAAPTLRPVPPPSMQPSPMPSGNPIGDALITNRGLVKFDVRGVHVSLLSQPHASRGLSWLRRLARKMFRLRLLIHRARTP